MFQAYFNSDTRRTSLIPMYRDPTLARGSVTLIVIQLTYLTYLLAILSNRSNTIFMYNNALTYTTYIVRDLLGDIGVEVIQQPPYSLDLNLIKNLQGLLKRQLLELFPKLYNIPNNDDTRRYLIEAIQYIQSQIEPEILRNLSLTIYNRVRVIIELEGWYTSYQAIRISQSIN